MYNVQKVPSN